MSAATDAIHTLIKDAARVAIEEAAPELIERLVPVIVEQVKAALATDIRLGGSSYLPVRIAAKIMSAHSTTIRKLISEGKLGRYSVEGQIRVKVSDIHAYLGRQGGPQSPTLDLRDRALAILKKAPSNDT